LRVDSWAHKRIGERANSPLFCTFIPGEKKILVQNFFMGFIKDFKAFAVKGSVVDLAVGVIIGGAFGKIVTSLVEDVVMPLVSIFTGGGTITEKFVVLKPGKEGEVYETLEQARKAGANVLSYGHFIQTVFDFFIIALFIFMAIKAIARLERKQAEAPVVPVGPSTTDKLLIEIRDLLKK